MITVTSYLGIGSNLGDRIENIGASIRYLKSIPRISVGQISRVYESPACGGPKNQPKYLNAAVKIHTALTPSDLLGVLKSIESKLKRKSSVKWGPRTIDLDILFYGDLVLLSDKLSIPHPLLHKRIFVLKPLSEIAAGLMHPLYKKSIKNLLEGLNKDKEIVPFSKE
jgi:2-amino-4-hydroxy-6-hydroxymethyldihydropteridine diphosphokinase